MFFVLSKLLNFLTKPFFVLSGLLIISYFIKNKAWAKRARIFVFIGFIITSNGILIDEVMRAWEIGPIAMDAIPNETFEAAIVLGGGADPERMPQDRLYFHKGADRVIHALYLYKTGKVKKIIFTGGKGEVFEEPERNNQQIRDFYILCGVKESDIIMENIARNTYENAVFTARLIDKNKKHILITSAFHMRRAQACFKKAGLDTLPFSCDFNSSKEKDRFAIKGFIPSAEAMSGWEIILKEWVGLMAYKISGYI